MNLDDFIQDLTDIRRGINYTVPKLVAKAMEENKDKNFRQEGYGEDGFERWPDRPFENELNYPKLNYTGGLKNSWKQKSKKKQASLYSNNKLAELHQTGGKTNGSLFIRKPPASRKPIRAQVDWVKTRQMVGVGERTYKQTYEFINKIFANYFN